MGLPKVRIFDLRLLGAISVVLIALAGLSMSESVEHLAPAHVARGQLGVQITSFAMSPAGRRMATTNTDGRLALRALENGWEIERFLDFPGYATQVAFSADGRALAAVGFAPRRLLVGCRFADEQADRGDSGSHRATETGAFLAGRPIHCRHELS